jgi:hypothetical protein
MNVVWLSSSGAIQNACVRVLNISRTEVENNQDEIRRLKSVVLAVRGVNQLLVQEKYLEEGSWKEYSNYELKVRRRI